MRIDYISRAKLQIKKSLGLAVSSTIVSLLARVSLVMAATSNGVEKLILLKRSEQGHI